MKRIGFTVREDVAEALKKQAKKEQRSVSNLVGVMLQEYLEGRKNEKSGDEYFTKHNKS